MKEDLIERITSKIFCDESFSNLVLRLCSVTETETAYLKRLEQVSNLKPRDVGISPFLTLDRTGNLQQIYSTQYNSGDVGGSTHPHLENSFDVLDAAAEVTPDEIRRRIDSEQVPYQKAI
jgi:hypothetical protein